VVVPDHGGTVPENLFGLPTHILLLHIVVVLLPLAAAATVLVALWPTFRHRWGLATLVGTFVTTLFVPLTSQAGENLAERLPDNALIARHADIGNQVTVWAAVFGLSLFAVVLIGLAMRAAAPTEDLSSSERWATGKLPAAWRETAPGWAPVAFRVAQVLAVLTAIGVTYVVIQAGHTGAQAVWTHYPNLQPSAG
jgi:hypothetical protein